MANSTILSLVQTSLQAMGVATYGNPSTVIANTNQDVVQTLALVNLAGDEAAREFDWESATKQHNFTATYFTYTGNTTADSTSVTSMSSIVSLDATFMAVGGSIPQDTFVVSATGTTVVLNRAPTATASTVSITFSKVLFAVASDFDRLVDRTNWDKSKHWEMLGPRTPQEREWLRSGYISTGPRIRWWKMGGYFSIWPPLGATEELSYEFQSKYWVLVTAASTPAPTKQSFTVDTDTCIFPDAMMRALIRYKYFEAKGFDSTSLAIKYQEQLDLAKAHDAGGRTLSMAPRPGDVLIGWGQLPDSGFGS